MPTKTKRTTPSDKTKFVAEHNAVDTIQVRRPFRMHDDNKRRFVRLEIAAPTSLSTLKSTSGKFYPKGDGNTIGGMILNVSAGGVLVDLEGAVNEGDVVVLDFTLQEVEHLNQVLGLVKRVDFDGEGWLVGVEFITRQRLADILSNGECDLIASDLDHFDERVQQLLKKYIYREATTDRLNRS